ncbi:hypothetical protein FHT44_000254 [Mycolicibacterium sp. BK634]|uniref:hypothetical protein n=1 Tax=Mycolicibacterium sp. BK634 TaxID=2587099 RepID=UPI00161EA72B|nr:hypothetical protein [Mycolicibacterium sp. BK634]MBB3747793.1 hypothetical protein [Mycolicibacterium sp. BK634]
MYSNIIGAALISVAHIVTSGSGSTTDIVSELQSQGFTVQFNGSPNGDLAQCTVTDVHRSSPTAYVDLDCPAGN